MARKQWFYDARVSHRNQTSRRRWPVVVFFAGMLAGFTWALLRRHPVSDYRTALREQRERERE